MHVFILCNSLVYVAVSDVCMLEFRAYPFNLQATSYRSVSYLVDSAVKRSQSAHQSRYIARTIQVNEWTGGQLVYEGGQVDFLAVPRRSGSLYMFCEWIWQIHVVRWHLEWVGERVWVRRQWGCWLYVLQICFIVIITSRVVFLVRTVVVPSIVIFFNCDSRKTWK